VPALADGYDHIVIYGPPEIEAIVKSALMAADLVLIPVQPSGVDVWGARAIVGLLADAAPLRPQLKAVFAVNRKISKTFLSQAVLKALEVYRLPILPCPITQRVAFAESVGSGRTVFDAGLSSLASQEALALAQEVLNHAEKAADRPVT
jgi:chromosome partitioning protein